MLGHSVYYYYNMTTFFLSLCGGGARQHVLHVDLLLYDHFLPISVRGSTAALPTAQDPRPNVRGSTAALPPPTAQDPRPKSCTNISNTHFTVIGIFYNNIMHTLSPSALPPLSNIMTRGEGGEGRREETRAVGGGGSSGGSSSSRTSA